MYFIGSFYLRGINLNNLKRIISTNHKLNFIQKNNYSSRYSYDFSNDPIINILLHYYKITMHNENKLIDIKQDRHELSFYINTKMININEPIFNAICSFIIRQLYENNNYCPDIDTLSFIPNVSNLQIFDKRKAQSKDFHIELFSYQKKDIVRMIEIENNINMSFDRNFTINLEKDEYKWDPHIDLIVNGPSVTKITSQGGILADTMGLGKTITTIGLINYGKIIPKTEIKTDKIYSKATLIIVPSHLAKQWADEYNKVHKKNKKIVVILTKCQHDKVTYKDLIEADLIIVTIQFLLNIKNYGSIYYDTRKGFNNDQRNIAILNYYEYLKKIDYNNITKPLFEYFHFNRVIIDEGHEIMESNNLTYKVNNFIHDFIRNINSNFKWYISGTPYTTINGLINIFNFLNIKIHIDDEIIKVNDIQITELYPYLTTSHILELIMKTVVIRHLKEDVKDSIKLLGHTETIEWVELTESEKNIYDSKLEGRLPRTKAERKLLQQICCHPLIAESFKKIIGKNPMSLDEVQEKLVEHHTKVIETYTKKIEDLDTTNQAYHMLLANYNSKITESKFILKTLEKINTKLVNEEENCIICYDNMEDPMLTPCGHIFCDRCITLCINNKPECPLCKTNVTYDKLVKIKNKNTQQIITTNPLIMKYGTKLGKLIQMVRELLAQDARIIIFSQWDEMLLLIRKSMSENNVDCSFIAGNVYHRNKAISKFKLGGKDNSVILLSLQNAASGTNLTEATHIFFVEPIDDTKENINAIESQAIGRAVRTGQKQVTQIIRILCKNTIEEEIYNKY